MTGPPPPSALDLYDVAYLAGGLDRVVDTALVALVRSGRVRVHSPGELATADLRRRHPVEAAVLDAVGPTGHRSVDTVRWRVATDERILDVGRRLQQGGLVTRFALASALRRGRPVSNPSVRGRKLLSELRAIPPADVDLRVALGGREALPDGDLRCAIFEQPRWQTSAGGHGKAPPALDFADGTPEANRTRARIVADANRLRGWTGP